jgi:peptide subunit release factor 1 (eRF1)
MITREDMLELAQFQGHGTDCAISFYFQPSRPTNKSHREDAILAKDLVRQALREAEKGGRNGCARSDLQRIQELSAEWQGSKTAKVVFACGSRNLWREFDLPPQFATTELFVNRRFHLKPLVLALRAQPRLWMVVLDRHRARIFDMHLDELKEREALFHSLTRRGRGDGFAGYDAGHAERSVSEEILHHYKNVSEYLRQGQEKGNFDNLIIGCQDVNWHEFETQLHPYVRKQLLGRFTADVATITEPQLRGQATEILRRSLDQHRHDLLNEVLSQAKGNGNGVTGLRRVLRSLELGEVQKLLIGENYSAHAVECSSCGHLDAHMVRYCPLCGRGTQEVEDVCEIIVPSAIRRGIELFFVKDEPGLDHVGNIAALLRFRSDQSKGRLAAAS